MARRRKKQPDPEQVRAEEESAAQFLQELAELSTRHGVVIDSCGCCNGPWLAPLGEDGSAEKRAIETGVMWDEDERRYR